MALRDLLLYVGDDATELVGADAAVPGGVDERDNVLLLVGGERVSVVSETRVSGTAQRGAGAYINSP